MTTKKSNASKFSALVKKIETSNEKFAKATPAKKILIVSRDVLSMLDLNRMEATHGLYFSLDTTRPEFENQGLTDKLHTGMQLSDLLKMPELPACNVCAIGGAMMATTMRLNKVRTQQGNKGYLDFGFIEAGSSHYCYSKSIKHTDMGMSDRAREVFPEQLLLCMERAFEGGYFGYSRCRSGQPRMRAIYQNLLDNKGKKFTNYRSTHKIVYELDQQ